MTKNKNKNKNNFQIYDFILILVVCCALMIDAFYIYYKYINQDITIGTNYISSQTGVDIIASEDLDEEEVDEYEERWFLEASYYNNSLSNGIEIQELNLNYFTDYSLTANTYRSTGMQYVGGDASLTDKTVSNEDEADSYVATGLYYYDTTDGISYAGRNINTILNRDAVFIISIDNEPYAIQLDGNYTTTKKLLFITQTVYHYYSYASLFVDIFNAIESNSSGYGDYYITVDLSEYFTIKKYDVDSGKFLDDDVSDVIKNYCVIKFHYEANGLVDSSQSIFGIVACNSSYDLEFNYDTDYWQARAIYTLTAEDFIYRYSELYNGYFATLSTEIQIIFNQMERVKIIVLLNLNNDYLINNNINLIGLDYYALKGFSLDTLQIISTNETNFYILENSLIDTTLKHLIYSNTISLCISENAIDDDYDEVIL